MSKFKFLRNTVPYFLATLASTIVTGVMPLAIASIPLIFAFVWVVLWAVVLLVTVFGGHIDLPMDEPIGIALIPLLMSVFGAISVSAAILLTVSFNLIFVLPLGIFIEILNKRMGLRNWFLRLGAFFSGGVVLGLIFGVIGMLLAKKIDTDISLFGQIGFAVFLGITGVVAEFIFGFTLMVIDIIQKGFKSGRSLFSHSQRVLRDKKA
jgi:hypothetical protein